MECHILKQHPYAVFELHFETNSNTQTCMIRGGLLTEKGETTPYVGLRYMWLEGVDTWRCVSTLGLVGLRVIYQTVCQEPASVSIRIDYPPVTTYGFAELFENGGREYDSWLEIVRGKVKVNQAGELITLDYESADDLFRLGWPIEYGAFTYDMEFQSVDDEVIMGWSGVDDDYSNLKVTWYNPDKRPSTESIVSSFRRCFGAIVSVSGS